MSDTRTLAPAPADGRAPPPVPPHRARSGSRRLEEITKILFVVPAALAIVALFGYPVVKNVLMSFQDYGLKTFFTGKAPVRRARRTTPPSVERRRLLQGRGQHRRCSRSARSSASS